MLLVSSESALRKGGRDSASTLVLVLALVLVVVVFREIHFTHQVVGSSSVPRTSVFLSHLASS